MWATDFIWGINGNGWWTLAMDTVIPSKSVRLMTIIDHTINNVIFSWLIMVWNDQPNNDLMPFTFAIHKNSSVFWFDRIQSYSKYKKKSFKGKICCGFKLKWFQSLLLSPFWILIAFVLFMELCFLPDNIYLCSMQFFIRFFIFPFLDKKFYDFLLDIEKNAEISWKNHKIFIEINPEQLINCFIPIRKWPLVYNADFKLNIFEIARLEFSNV